MPRVLAPSLVVLAALAGAPALSAADAPPRSDAGKAVFTERVSGIAAFRQWLLASPLAQQWQGKDAEPVRQQVDQALDQLKHDQGIDVREMLNDLDEIRLQVVPADATAKGDPLGLRLSLSLPKTADDLWGMAGAKGKLDGQEFAFDDGGRLGRSGSWLTFARGASASLVPDPGPAAAQIAGTFDLDALWTALKQPDPAAVAHALGIRGGSFSSTLGDTGSRDRLMLDGAKLPLAPIDPSVLAVLPADAMTVEAIGLDGTALDQALTAMAKDSQAVADAIARAEKNFGALGFGELRPLLRSLSGTAVLAITNGVPFPGGTLMIPSSDAVDAVIAGLAEKTGLDLAGAREQAVLVPLPPQVPLMLQLRRTPTHWVLSTDPTVLDRLGQAKPAGGFDAAAKLAQLGDKVEARLLWCNDNQAQARMLQGFMAAGAGQGKSKEQAEGMRVAAKLLADLGPKMQPTVLAVVAGPDGARVEARNAVMQVSSVAVLSGMMLPAINMTREAARRSQSGNNERQLVLGALVYASENDKWPMSLEDLVKDPANQMPAKLLVSPSAPSIAGAYLYVRPDMNAPATQPVIVEDPACNRHRRGSMVAFADGHVEFLKGTRAWEEARRLSQLPKAKQGGIEAKDWPSLKDEDLPPSSEPKGKADF